MASMSKHRAIHLISIIELDLEARPNESTKDEYISFQDPAAVVTALPPFAQSYGEVRESSSPGRQCQES